MFDHCCPLILELVRGELKAKYGVHRLHNSQFCNPVRTVNDMLNRVPEVSPVDQFTEKLRKRVASRWSRARV